MNAIYEIEEIRKDAIAIGFIPLNKLYEKYG
jgi:hypothetical protein